MPYSWVFISQFFLLMFISCVITTEYRCYIFLLSFLYDEGFWCSVYRIFSSIILFQFWDKRIAACSSILVKLLNLFLKYDVQIFHVEITVNLKVSGIPIRRVDYSQSFVLNNLKWFLYCLGHGCARVAHCVTARWRNFSHYCRPLRHYDVWLRVLITEKHWQPRRQQCTETSI